MQCFKYIILRNKADALEYWPIRRARIACRAVTLFS